MRLLTLLPYIALLPSLGYAGPLGYNLRRHEDSPQGRKQLITTVMVFTTTMVLEVDLPPNTCTTASTEPIPPPAESTPTPSDNVPKVTITQVVTVTKKKQTATDKQPPTPSTTESTTKSTTETLSRLKPLPRTKKTGTTTDIGTSTTSVPAPEVTEQPPPPPQVPTLQSTSTYILSRLKPLPDERSGKYPEGPVVSTTAPVDPTTTETPIAKTTNAKTTREPAPTSTSQYGQPSPSLPETPTTTGFVPPTNPPFTGPFFKENVPVAIKHNQGYNGLKEGDECDPSANILACAGTMGKSILQCDVTKKYKSVLPCLRDTRCFATPQLLAPGVLVTCDTTEDAGKKFNMSAEELLKEIQ